MLRMVGIFFVVLVFGCSALGVSAPQGKESLAITSPFPYPCSGPYKDKKISKDVVLKELEAHKKWLADSKDPEGHQANFCGAKFPPGSNFERTDLRYAIFQMAMLADTDFKGAKKKAGKAGANFTEAKLNEAQLQGANLSGANFSKADLTKAALDDAMLHDATFENADLREASLRRTMLYQAKFHEAKLHKAYLQGVGLMDVEGFTQSQINMACLDGVTILPKDLTRPKPC